ncbi:MAG: trehalose-phosphatase [Planctomycetota bacterium]
MLSESLVEKVRQFARQPVLLVGSDYDGTLSPIVEDPEHAVPDRESLVALRQLAELPGTHVAVISGRSLSDLARLTGAPDAFHLVGSHGSEFDADFAAALPAETKALRDRLFEELETFARRGAGFAVESKPASVAFHYRNADPALADEVVREVEQGPAKLDGVTVKLGKKVIELGVLKTHKGDALRTIRSRLGATAALFVGDDVTDEDAFETLHGPDLGVKVGEGDSAAGERVGDTMDVARLLALLAEERQRWTSGDGAHPIEKHSLLSDLRTCALVSTAGEIVWMCAPRADSSSVFGTIVGGAQAGRFAIEPVDPDAREPQQVYHEHSMVLETSRAGLKITDYMDVSGTRAGQRAGRTDLVRVISGSGRARVTFAPRLDYGRSETRLSAHDRGLVVEGMPDPLVLRSPGVSWEIVREGPHDTAVAEVEPGVKPVVLEMRWGTGSLEKEQRTETQRRVETDKYWTRWAERLELPELATDLVMRSALTLRGLCHGPTGAVLAAATTSLPEEIGGVRNWDYRYCWLRDAAISVEALVKLGSTEEALKYLDWLLGVLDRADAPERLRPLYTVAGGELGFEGELGDLPGYAGSRPVRIGNGAANQLQLDVFGPVVELVYELLLRGAPITFEHWQLVEQMATAVSRRWTEPDHGIWEVRGPRRHHVHSKVMCWVTVDRAAKIAERYLGRQRGDWAELAEEIREDVLSRGYNEKIRAFTAAYPGEDYAGEELDAAVLLIGTAGMLDPTDERYLSTVNAIERELRVGPTVWRYRYDDGLPGEEGGFHFCTTWLIDAYAACGRDDDAMKLFSDYCQLVGPTGLLPEEYDPATGRSLGNTPQAYSHAGLIFNALRLAQADA